MSDVAAAAAAAVRSASIGHGEIFIGDVWTGGREDGMEFFERLYRPKN